MTASQGYRVDFEIPAPTIVITGPTAGGKGRLATQVSQALDRGVISLDSMKVYRGMDIGSAKPDRAIRESVPFHLMDVRDPWESFSVGDYIDLLEKSAARFEAPWIFAGGTAFYLNALLHGIFRGPPPDDALRASLEEEATRIGVATLHERMATLDPASATRIDRTDLRRIVRALEVMHHCGEPLSVLQALRRPILPVGRYRLIGIARPRNELYERIDRRVERMFTVGWVDEVRRLIEQHDPPWSDQAQQSIGYAQIREALEQGEDPGQRQPVIQQRTRHFARHQLIWFRKMPIEWWRPEEADALTESIASSLDHYASQGAFPTPDPARLVNQHL